MYLRSYEERDLEALYALDVRCFEPRFRFSKGMMRQVVSGPDAVVRLACEGSEDASGSLLGFCVVSLEQDGEASLGYVTTLDVDPLHRGRGVATTLMTALEAIVAARGVWSMSLHVYAENAAAIKLYERLGYARERREPDFYGAGFDGWLYRKPLRPGLTRCTHNGSQGWTPGGRTRAS